MGAPIADVELGLLLPHESLPEALAGKLRLGGREVALLIQPDGEDIALPLALAREAARSIVDVDVKAKRVASDKLLRTYNISWREFRRARSDGKVEDVCLPEMTPEEFMSRLTLVSLEACGADCIVLCYSDDTLFAGHSVFVTSFDGLLFGEANAQLFG